MKTKTVTLHGRDVTYAEAGSGPALLLIHGMGGTLENWEVRDRAARARAHRRSARTCRGTAGRPRAPATTRSGPLRPGFATCSSPSATSERRSWGTLSAAASRCSSPTSSPSSPSASCSSQAVGSAPRSAASCARRRCRAQICSSPRPPVPDASPDRRSRAGLPAVGLQPNPDVAEVARGYASLADPDHRAAFLATLRSVVGTGGQRVNAGDRLYLTEGIPVLIIWGARDPIIPCATAKKPVSDSGQPA